MKKIVECVPNFSEGCNREVIELIADAFRGKTGVKLLDYSGDADHHRSVITAVGEPHALKESVIQAIGAAVEHIDLTAHRDNTRVVRGCSSLVFIKTSESISSR